MIQVTESAIQQIKELLNFPDQNTVRLYIAGVGWGGPNYGMALEESIDDAADIKTEIDGVQFVYNSGLKAYMDDVKVDYTKSLFGKGFRISSAGGSSC